MSILKTFKIIFSMIGILILVCIAMLFALNYNSFQLVESQEIRYRSYQTADELRQSSDDLTRLARTYVITSNPIYEKYYWEVLDIRNGKKERPIDYHQIYWDLVLEDGKRPREGKEKKPLQEMMIELGFSEKEFQKLKEAQENSNALVSTEEIAMSAIKGTLETNSILK